jgi:hypothetical protein
LGWTTSFKSSTRCQEDEVRTLDNEELLALTADGCSGKLEQQSQQLLPHHLMVRSYIAQDPGKRADLDGPMIRNGDVMCAIACSAQPYVTSALSGLLVPEPVGRQACPAP